MAVWIDDAAKMAGRKAKLMNYRDQDDLACCMNCTYFVEQVSETVAYDCSLAAGWGIKDYSILPIGICDLWERQE